MVAIFRKLVISLVLCTLYISPVKAVPLTVNGGWDFFTFPGQILGPEDPARVDGLPPDPSFSWDQEFSFVLAQPALLRIQDIGSGGDRFRIFDNGAELGMTSALFPDNIGDYFDPDLAALDPALDQGSFLLSAGNHTISGVEINHSTDSGGAAALRVDTIPEPTMIALLALGFAALGISRRRKLKSQCRPVSTAMFLCT
ncbi:MAG: PEP-CTERM sorting domain-containing protein [Nitrosomonas sp.]|nr:PEP-CTERM sorting domain-containing protein [Nitrosomonas sp.]